MDNITSNQQCHSIKHELNINVIKKLTGGDKIYCRYCAVNSKGEIIIKSKL